MRFDPADPRALEAVVDRYLDRVERLGSEAWRRLAEPPPRAVTGNRWLRYFRGLPEFVRARSNTPRHVLNASMVRLDSILATVRPPASARMAVRGGLNALLSRPWVSEWFFGEAYSMVEHVIPLDTVTRQD